MWLDDDCRLHPLSAYALKSGRRQALRIGLPQFAARFQPPPLWLGERIHEALAEPAEEVSKEQFEKTMAAIADNR